jgi:hypothetical protein
MNFVYLSLAVSNRLGKKEKKKDKTYEGARDVSRALPDYLCCPTTSAFVHSFLSPSLAVSRDSRCVVVVVMWQPEVPWAAPIYYKKESNKKNTRARDVSDASRAFLLLCFAANGGVAVREVLKKRNC